MPISTMAANPFTRSTEAISEVPPIVPPLIRPPAPLLWTKEVRGEQMWERESKDVYVVDQIEELEDV